MKDKEIRKVLIAYLQTQGKEMRIAKLIGKNKGLSFSEDAVAKLETIFDLARQQNDFGNGRYVRNILEQARMSQATRLMEADFDSIKIGRASCRERV